MKVIQLFGGPGAGKSTIAAYLYYRLKQAGIRAELVGEAAREIIYNANPGQTARQLLDNQLYVTGMQYERLKRLERRDIQVAVCDSPFRMGALYAATPEEQEWLRTGLERMEKQFTDRTDIFVQRTPGQYDKESRAQSEAEALKLDETLYSEFAPYNYVVEWGQEATLADDLLADFREHGCW